MCMITYATLGRHAQCVDFIPPQGAAMRHHLILENENHEQRHEPAGHFAVSNPLCLW